MGVFHAEGRHRAIIDDARLTKSQKGNPQVEFVLRLLGIYNEHNELEDCIRGRFPPSVYLSVTEATMGTDAQPGWVRQTLEYMQFDGDFGNIGQFVGWEGDVYCAHGQNDAGQPREQWSIERPRERKNGSAPEKKEVRSLNTKFGKFFKKPEEGKKHSKPEAKKEPEPAVNGESGPPQETIPF